MPIPNSRLAVVPEEKLIDYLLNPTHPVGGPKARWFLSRGFRASDPENLRVGLLAIVRDSDDYSEAIEFHLAGMVEDGVAIPEPSSQVEYLEVNAS